MSMSDNTKRLESWSGKQCWVLAVAFIICFFSLIIRNKLIVNIESESYQNHICFIFNNRPEELRQVDDLLITQEGTIQEGMERIYSTNLTGKLGLFQRTIKDDNTILQGISQGLELQFCIHERHGSIRGRTYPLIMIATGVQNGSSSALGEIGAQAGQGSRW